MSDSRVFLVRIFPHSDWIRRDTSYLSVFSPNAGKYDQKNSEYGHFLRSVNEHNLSFLLQFFSFTRWINPYQRCIWNPTKHLNFFFENSWLHFCQKASAKMFDMVLNIQQFSCEFCKILKNAFSYRTPPMAASSVWVNGTRIFL